MNPLLLLLTPIAAAQPVPPARVVALAPMPVTAPDAAQLAAWVADLSHPDYERQHTATQSLVKAGRRAKAVVPDLVKILRVKPPADPAGGGIDPQYVRRVEHAIEILTAIGPDAKEAVPALMPWLQSGGFGYFTERVAIALVSVDGPKIEATRALLLSSAKCTPILLETSWYLSQHPAQVVPQIVTLCGDENAVVREKAAIVLGSLKNPRTFEKNEKPLIVLAGHGSKGVPAALEKLLADESPTVRMAAAAAISSVAPQLTEKTIGPVIGVMSDPKLAAKAGNYRAGMIFQGAAEPAAKELIPLLDSDNETARTWAINTLASLPVRGQLEEVLKHAKSARTRQGTAIVFGSRYGEEPAAVAALKGALGDSEFVVRFAAAESLVRLGGKGTDPADAAVPVLIEGLRHAEAPVRVKASYLLVWVGKPARAAVPDLRRLLTDAQAEVAREAAISLVEVAPAEAAGAVPVLASAVKADHDTEAIRAARSLAKLGAAAKAAVPALVERFEAKDCNLRLAAAEAAARIDPAQIGKASEVLVGLLRDPKNSHGLARRDAAQALIRIGPGAKASVPALVELLKAERDFPAEIAVTAVLLDAEGANPARTWIREQISKDTGAVYDIIEQLAELGAGAKPFIPELKLMLGAKMPHARVTAAELLGDIGADANESLPALKVLAAKDPRKDVREAASKAVKQIEGK